MNARLLAVVAFALAGASAFGERAAFRPPAVPLAVNDPYLSLWSGADNLMDAETMHWSRDAQPLSVVGEVKGKRWRFCGVEPKDAPAAKQLSVEVRCCETVYLFEADGERVELRFSTPLVPGDWDVFSRPVTYLTVTGAKATVTISPAFATDDDTAPMVTNVTTVAGCPARLIVRREPKYLEPGDRVRPNGGSVWLVDAGDRFLLAFDAVKDMTFLSQEVKAWWRRDGKSFETMLAEAVRDYPRLMKRMADFDRAQRELFVRLGGEKYATFAELAWRQSYGAGKLVASPAGEMLYFSKENTSNGCTATVDILYPQLPHLMLGGAALVKAAMLPDLLYAASDGWPFDYAPHDLGRFPCADRQRYGMGKNKKGEWQPDAERMPVEESGNLILCLYAVARLEGNADFAARFWPSVEKWAAYLERTGFDPENQLCTDDFAGHLAHNANLSIKSIAAFEAYARLAEMRGLKDVADKFHALARTGAANWQVRAAGGKDGASTLAFGETGTWSLKYNLALARALGIDLFPDDVRRREVAAYLKNADPLGLPLDCRKHWCKVDWTVWAATLAETREDFERLIAPVYAYLGIATDRVAFTDLYYTETAKCTVWGPKDDRFVGFNARPAIGGIYLPVLSHPWTEKCGAAGCRTYEAPYAFKERLVTVHRTDRRDLAEEPTADEYVLSNGVRIVIPDNAPALVRHAAADFADYLLVSMRINASVRTASEPDRPGLVPAVTLTLGALEKRGYVTTVSAAGIALVASDAPMAAQAFYRLEDTMNFRRGPFVRFGETRRFPIFDDRMTFSGFGDDLFPDAHLNQIAHAGFTRIEIWMDDYDVISQGSRQDINDLIDRAEKFGLSTLFEPRNHAFVHPDDPKAEAAYREAYGRLTKYYPKAASAFFCGEVCEFPSKDPRSNGRSYRDKSPKDTNDKRPNPGWYPCSDWADWAKKVLPIVREGNPDFDFVFMTYNWGNEDEQARADLISSLPKGVTLIPTFEMFEKHVKRNGLVSPVADYSLAFPGPGKYFKTEAAQAKASGLKLWSNCNSAGLTWDFGNIPYQPAPWQWKKKWDGLKEAHAKWNLTGLRENHEYGWYPSFIAEIEKEYMTEGGDDFETILRNIAARDFGAANVEKALAAWRFWSRAADDYVPTDENQYGPCRIGPAYPYNFYGADLQEGWKPPKDFPLEPGAVFSICFFDFAKPIPGLGVAAVTLSEEDEQKEIELFESQASDYDRGAALMREIAASLPAGRRTEALRQAALGEYLMRACLTTVHLKAGRRSFRKNDRKEVERLARLEYANAKAALAAVDADSRLGWLCSSGYTGGRAQIEWKLRKMRELYGEEIGE